MDNDAAEFIAKMVRETSVSRLRILSRRDDIAIVPMDREPLVYAHWMSMILASGQNLRITFKAHFMSRAAKFFASKAYGKDALEISRDRAVDFFREFCNLTAGQLKLILAEHEIKVGVSLPALARGFDEIYYVRAADGTTKSWILECNEQNILCSTHIEIFRKLEFKKSGVGEIKSGNVDFL